MPNQSYFNRIGINASKVNTYLRLGFLPEISEEQTPAMSLGVVLHSLLLEGKKTYFVQEARTKEGKAIITEKESQGLIRISEEDAENLVGIKQAFDNAFFGEVLSGRSFLSEAEKELYASLPFNGDSAIPLKGCLDILVDLQDSRLIVDLKTTKNLEGIPSLRRRIITQLHFYRMLLEMNSLRDSREIGMKVIFVEAAPPFNTVIVNIAHDQDIDNSILEVIPSVWREMTRTKVQHIINW